MTHQIFSQSQSQSCPPSQMHLARIMGSLSHALDMTAGQLPGHSVRCAYIGTRLGDVLGLGHDAARDLYDTLLLKDLGCSSNSARVCELYLTDDIDFKREFKALDGSIAAALRFVTSQTGLQSGLAERVRRIIHVLQNGGEISRGLIETRCQRGAQIAAKMRFPKGVQDGILSLDEHWDGGGQPLGLRGEAIPVVSNIALLAQVVDVFSQSGGRDAAMTEIKGRSGGWFNPDLMTAFGRLSADPGFWADLADPNLEQMVFDMPPARRTTDVDAELLDDVAAAFSDVVDAKSPFTANHSSRVTYYADVIAEEMGLTADHRRWLRRGALLHDLGKLSVSNQVLDKPGALDDVEWKSIRTHPGNGAAILSRIDVFNDIATIAAAHHEKLDGSGYPAGLDAGQLPLEVRIVTVADVFDALSADRPYRGAMPIAQVMEILEADIGTAFDGTCVEALQAGLSRMGAAS